MKKLWVAAAACLMMIFISGFRFRQESRTAYSEDFESFSTERELEKAFSVWEDGAVMTAEVVELNHAAESHALKVAVISPHSRTGVENGSVYHILGSAERDWSEAAAIQFWVFNADDEELSLSLNIKEEYSEYWAPGNDGIFFEQQEGGKTRQHALWYGSLLIRPWYRGVITIPMQSLVVPDWNTARGDEILDLGRVESLGFGIDPGNPLPHVLYIDDIQVLYQSVDQRLDIRGAEEIKVPGSGEHRERYEAVHADLDGGEGSPAESAWEILVSPDPAIEVDPEGWLVVPAGVRGGDLVLEAVWQGSDRQLASSLIVSILEEGGQPAEESGGNSDTLDDEPGGGLSAYDEFSGDFEEWARENRSVFVILSVSFIVLVLLVLAFFQRKLA